MCERGVFTAISSQEADVTITLSLQMFDKSIALGIQ